MVRLTLLSIGVLWVHATSLGQTDTLGSSQKDTAVAKDAQLKGDTVSNIATTSSPLSPSASERDKNRV